MSHSVFSLYFQNGFWFFLSHPTRVTPVHSSIMRRWRVPTLLVKSLSFCGLLAFENPPLLANNKFDPLSGGKQVTSANGLPGAERKCSSASGRPVPFSSCFFFDSTFVPLLIDFCWPDSLSANDQLIFPIKEPFVRHRGDTMVYLTRLIGEE